MKAAKRRVGLHIVALASALAGGLAPPASAAVIVVETIVDTIGGPLCSLRDAIVAANLDAPAGGCPAGAGDDEIDLTGLSGTMEVFHTLPMIGGSLQATVIRGPGPDRLAISGLGSHPVFATNGTGTPEPAVIEGVTIRDGSPHCILGEGSLTLRDCRITSCTGGGAALETGEVGLGARVERCLIDGNDGPAIRTGGVAGSGGIWLVNSTLSDNAYGVAINAEGPGALSRIFASTIANSRIANLWVGTDQRLAIDHTILKHYPGRPRRDAPGVSCVLEGVSSLPPGTPNLVSFVSLSDDGSCGLIGQGDLEGVDPLLGPLADNGGPTATRALLPGSPAIDAGESACPGPDGDLVVDQRGPGFPRPLPGAPDAPTRCDLGAVEMPEPRAGLAAAIVGLVLGSIATGRAHCRRRRGAHFAAVLLVALAAESARAGGPVVGWGAGAPPPDLASGQTGIAAIDAGGETACGLLADTGAVRCWGNDANGRTQPPDAVNGALGVAEAVSVGVTHACAVRAVGGVVCWGSNYAGEASPPPSVADGSGYASAVATGANHSCAIGLPPARAVVCWGSNQDGRATPPPLIGGAAAITAGWAHTCAIEYVTGNVVCWGSNAQGAAEPPLVLSQPAGKAVAIDAGPASGHTCALSGLERAVVCWGRNLDGESSPPDAVNGTAGGARDVRAGGRSACAIESASGAVVCWGANDFGQAQPPPEVDAAHGGAAEIAAGEASGCATRAADGGVACWGNYYQGQATPPASLSGAAGDATAIAAGDAFSCAARASDGGVECWGDGRFGQLDVPSSVDGSAGSATAVAAGSTGACALRSGSGAVVCWGFADAPPDAVDGTAGTASQIGVGGDHACAIRAGTGAVVCWGQNGVGQTTVPPQVDGSGGTASALSVGRYHACAIQAGSGAVVCWGWNVEGQVTVPPSVGAGSSGAVGIAAGGYHSCAIRADTGAVVCWGSSFAGASTPPASVDGSAGSAVALAAGGYRTCAVRAATNQVVCWGDASYGGTSPPAALDGTGGAPQALALGTYHALAITVPAPGAGAGAAAALATLATLARARTKRRCRRDRRRGVPPSPGRVAALAALSLPLAGPAAALDSNPIDPSLPLAIHARAACLDGTMLESDLIYVDGEERATSHGGVVSENPATQSSVTATCDAAADLAAGTMGIVAVGRSFVDDVQQLRAGASGYVYLYDTLTVEGSWDGVRNVELELAVDGAFLVSLSNELAEDLQSSRVQGRLELRSDTGLFEIADVEIEKSNGGIPFLSDAFASGGAAWSTNASDEEFDPADVRFTLSAVFPATTSDRTFTFLGWLYVGSSMGFTGPAVTSADGFADFGETARFSLTAPPDVTVTSASGRFLTSAPAPAAGALQAAALGALAAQAARRTRQTRGARSPRRQPIPS